MTDLMTSVPVSPRAFNGAFGTHVTLAARPGGGTGDLALFAAARGVKHALIVLDRGQTRSQPMLTVQGEGTLATQIEAARSLSRELADAGFRVVRVKVEAAPWNEDVPASDAAAARLGDAMYFEHHVKVVLDGHPGDGPLPALLHRQMRPHPQPPQLTENSLDSPRRCADRLNPPGQGSLETPQGRDTAKSRSCSLK